LPSFGEKLKLEREKRKITLEQISSTTKIGTRMLQALEEEKFSQLPGGIFNKGFVRAYARTLGLDEDQTVADYLEASGDAPRLEPGVRENVRDNTRDNASRTTPLRITDEGSGRLEIRAEMASRQLPWGIFAVVLLIIALGLSLWNYRRLEHERLGNPPKASQHAATQAPATPPAEQSAALPASTSPASPPSPASAPANSTAAPAASPSDEKPAASPSPPDAKPEAVTPSALPAPGEFVVSIQARNESWLSVIVDGKPVGSEMVEAGAERSFRSRKLVIVKAGNVGALDFRLNGGILPIAGDVGQVKTVTIGPAGLLPSSASPSAQ
jgi:cytoskeleton protein RodZ